MSEDLFKKWPKTPRLIDSDVTITEKIDGTNGAVIVTESGEVCAQSRNRVLGPNSDNFGFGAWVSENAETLAEDLGPGHHFGEWWGHGINRGYGLPAGDRRFSLFNVERHSHTVFSTPALGVVPVLGTVNNFGQGGLVVVLDLVYELVDFGSLAEPGYDNPEGIIIYHHRAKQLFKVYVDELV